MKLGTEVSNSYNSILKKELTKKQTKPHKITPAVRAIAYGCVAYILHETRSTNILRIVYVNGTRKDCEIGDLNNYTWQPKLIIRKTEIGSCKPTENCF